MAVISSFLLKLQKNFSMPSIILPSLDFPNDLFSTQNGLLIQSGFFLWWLIFKSLPVHVFVSKKNRFCLFVCRMDPEGRWNRSNSENPSREGGKEYHFFDTLLQIFSASIFIFICVRNTSWMDFINIKKCYFWSGNEHGVVDSQPVSFDTDFSPKQSNREIPTQPTPPPWHFFWLKRPLVLVPKCLPWRLKNFWNWIGWAGKEIRGDWKIGSNLIIKGEK